MYISSPVSGDTVCYGDQFEVVSWYPAVTTPGKYLAHRPGWRVNGSILTLDGMALQYEMINITAAKLIVDVANVFSANNINAFSCFLVLVDGRLNDSSQQVCISIMGGKWHA